MNGAIPLVIRDDSTRKLSVTPEAIKFLSTITTPIGVAGVCGANRTAKSSLANLAILSKQSFAVGSTIAPCTKGLYVATEVIQRQSVPYIFLDSEGTASLESSYQEDIEIMALMYLLTSVFIYNSMHRIDETNLNVLSLVTITIKKLQQSNPELVDYPLFVWVLRDFNLLLQDKAGQKMNADEYLKHVLEESPHPTKKRKLEPGETIEEEKKDVQTDFHEIKQVIRRSFQSFHCITFCTPSSDSTILQNISHVSKKKLNPEFQRKLLDFQHLIDHKIFIKTFCGKPVTGPLFLLLLEKYVLAFNSGTVPIVKNQYSLLAERSCRDGITFVDQILEQVHPVYRYVKQHYVLMTHLQEFMQRLRAFIYQEYKRHCYEPDQTVAKEYFKDVEMKVNAFERKVMGKNMSNLPLFVKKMCEQKWKENKDLWSHAVQEYHGVAETSQKHFVTFCETLPLPSFHPVENNTCFITYSSWLKHILEMSTNHMDRFKKQMEQMEIEVQHLKQEIQSKEKEVSENRSQFESSQFELKELKHQADLQLLEVESLKKELTVTRHENSVQRTRLEDLTSKITQQGNAKVEIDSLKAQLQQATKTISDLEKQAITKESLEQEAWQAFDVQMSNYKSKLQEQSTIYEQERNQLDSKWKNSQEQIKKQEAIIEKLTQKQTLFKQKVKEQENVLIEEKKSFDHLQMEFRSKLTEFSHLNKTLYEEKTTWVCKNKSLEDENQRLKDIIKILKDKSVQYCENEQKLISSQQSEIHWRAQCQQSQQDVTRLQSELQDKLDKITDLKRKLNEVQSAFRAMCFNSMSQKYGAPL